MRRRRWNSTQRHCPDVLTAEFESRFEVILDLVRAAAGQTQFVARAFSYCITLDNDRPSDGTFTKLADRCIDSCFTRFRKNFALAVFLEQFAGAEPCPGIFRISKCLILAILVRHKVRDRVVTSLLEKSSKQEAALEGLSVLRQVRRGFIRARERLSNVVPCIPSVRVRRKGFCDRAL